MGRSDELLSFDCGGQQWVLENAFPAGTLRLQNCMGNCSCCCFPNAGIPTQNPAKLPTYVLCRLFAQACMFNDCCCSMFRDPSGADISYMEQLLAEIEKAGAHQHAVPTR